MMPRYFKVGIFFFYKKKIPQSRLHNVVFDTSPFIYKICVPYPWCVPAVSMPYLCIIDFILIY